MILRYFAVVSLLVLESVVKANEDRVAGIYQGIIWSNGNKQGTTEFSLSGDGSLTGEYRFGSAENQQTGILTDCELDGLELSCIWRDSYGAGDLIVIFNQDFSSFKGGWYTEINQTGSWLSDESYPWSGSKQP